MKYFSLLISLLSSTYAITDYLPVDNFCFKPSLNNIIDKSLNITDCKNLCAINSDCLGILENNTCFLLNNVDNLIESNNCSSYYKMNHYLLPEKKHDIVGRIYDTYYNNEYLKVKIYLDLNHNGELDNYEPYQLVGNNETFYFRNLDDGVYLLRQEDIGECIQVFPGKDGVHIYGFGDEGHVDTDGNIDKVIRYSCNNCNKNNSHIFNVGYKNTNEVLQVEDDFSWLLSPNKYMSFSNHETLIVSFIDESIINRDGLDLFVEIMNKTNLKCHISISNNNIDYKHLGTLIANSTNNIYGFNLDYNGPISYVKLHFFGGNGNMDIVRIYGNIDSTYNPSYGYRIKIPNNNNNEVVFFNDCGYELSCWDYCNFHIFDNDEYFSCLTGCEMYNENKNCFCDDLNKNKFSLFYDDDYSDYYDFSSNDDFFSEDGCNFGCIQQLKKYVYPNYLVFENSIDNLEYRNLNININCTNSCIDELINNCQNNTCSSFSINHHGGFINERNEMNQHNNSLLYLKRENMFDTYTSTSISSFTSTTESTTSSSISESTTSRSTSESTTSSSTSESTTSSSTSESTTSSSTTSHTHTSHTHTTTDTSNTLTSHTHTTTDTSNTLTSHTHTTTDTHTSIINNTNNDKSQIDNTDVNRSKKKKNKSKKIVTVTLILLSMILLIIVVGFFLKKYSTIKNRSVEPASYNGGFSNPLYNDPNLYRENEENEETDLNSYSNNYAQTHSPPSPDDYLQIQN